MGLVRWCVVGAVRSARVRELRVTHDSLGGGAMDGKVVPRQNMSVWARLHACVKIHGIKDALAATTALANRSTTTITARCTSERHRSRPGAAVMEAYTHFVVTPWRDSQELIQLRRDLYQLNDDNVDRRQGAVNKVRTE